MKQLTKGQNINVRQRNGEVVKAKVIGAAQGDSIPVRKPDGIITDVWLEPDADGAHSALYGD